MGANANFEFMVRGPICMAVPFLAALRAANGNLICGPAGRSAFYLNPLFI
jgi:hypothetical protein